MWICLTKPCTVGFGVLKDCSFEVGAAIFRCRRLVAKPALASLEARQPSLAVARTLSDLYFEGSYPPGTSFCLSSIEVRFSTS